MSSSVEICNMALARLGQSRITALTDSGIESQMCNLYYESVRDELLASYDWPFAIKRAALAADAGTNLTPYSYKYVLPSDFFGMMNQLSSDDYSDITDEWRVEGNCLLSDLSPNYIKYIRKVTTSSELPALFVKAFYLTLAKTMCQKLTQNEQLESKIELEAAGAILVAQGKLGGNSKSEDAPEALWSE